MAATDDNTSADTMVDPEKESQAPGPATTEDSGKQQSALSCTTAEEQNMPDKPEPDAEASGDANTAPNANMGAPLDRAPSQAQKLGKQKIFVIMGALCLVVFLAALDMTIVSTALPTMAKDFHATESGYSWMASSYLLANAACIPLWGKLSDVFGRKPVIMLANSLFLVGSLISALAINLTMIIAGRGVQGVGGGGILVLAQICVSDLFSVRDRPVFYALFGGVWAIAGALGPIIGGAFTTDVTWRWCFYLNLPIGGTSFTILTLLLNIESEKTPLLAGLRSIDWVGVVLSIGGTLMFLFGLEFGGISHPWGSATVICLIVFGVVTWALFMTNESKFAKYPIIPTRLFHSWHNVLMLILCFCHGCVFIAGSYYLPLYYQTVLLATPIRSGVDILPQVLFLATFSAGTGVFIKKTGRYREIIMFGFTFMTLGFGLFIDFKPYISWPRIILFQFIAGAGVGPIFQAPLVALQANIHPSDVASATATFGFVRQIAASMSVVLGTVIYQNELRKRLPDLISSLGAKTAMLLVKNFAGSDKTIVRQLPEDQKRVVLEALTWTMSRMWIFYTAIAGFGFLLTFLIRPVELSKTHVQRKTGLAEQERARQEFLAAKKEKARKQGDSPQTDV